MGPEMSLNQKETRGSLGDRFVGIGEESMSIGKEGRFQKIIFWKIYHSLWQINFYNFCFGF
jgi:hypothetical protein